MKYQFENKLRGRAEEFLEALRSARIDGAIVEDSFREYAVKVSVSKEGKPFGTVVLYYSPKSDTFSMKTRELKDKSIVPALERCWTKQQPREQEHGSHYEIYVDGSYIDGATGYGAVVLRDGKVVDELFGAVEGSEANGTRQVAGELIAVKEALNWCLKHSVEEVSIYYDYFGIEKWATGQWKTNQPLTQEYSWFVRQCPIKIHWHKVDSHTGNRWNDRADLLAKKGAGLRQALPGSAGVSPAAPIETDLVSDLLEKTDAWIEFLMMRGIEASVDRVYNEQFARIFIIQDERAVGTFDLYNTKKKKLSPYLHDFRDDELKLRIENLWKEFRVT